MTGNPVFLIELLIFSAAALAWGGWELWSVRRSRDAKDPPAPKPSDSASADDPGHPEG